ncbi:MAG: DoxX family protein [Amycolatopsis sp.]|uniref:DoxX family protein n=1 Tax=Amycolatopsis sp. TaxID=37632 RepID=UPI002615D8E6|nr:DoxX family protein [Amycolatopsis sp.]MCU1684620.1 DoxX family protein [Amycolatopsis sp.]
MTVILRRVARPLLASIFIFGGINALRDSAAHAKAAGPFLDSTLGKLDDVLPDAVPRDPVTLVRIDAAVKVGAGLALATGKAPRFASLLLLGSLVPTTLATHRFWDVKEPGERQAQTAQFIKNASIAGGLLIASGDTAGKPSLAWRTRRAAKRAGKQAEKVGKRAEKALPT